MLLSVLYQDPWLAVVDKPAGLMVHDSVLAAYDRLDKRVQDPYLNYMRALAHIRKGEPKRAEELACANYILYSYQYTEILEDFLHYLMGRNRDSVCYYPEEGKTSDYLLLIAQQVSLTGKH